MARAKWEIVGSVAAIGCSFAMASLLVSAERGLKPEPIRRDDDFLVEAFEFLWQSDKSGYHHVWPELKFGWKIVLGSIIGFFGAAFGSVGGVGGGGIFVPMLSLVIGFDPKSATAISKCMIMGAAASTVYYNLKLRHPTLDMPIIDYDLALLMQPMLMLGISIGVTFNVIFADWMVTVLLIVLFICNHLEYYLRMWRQPGGWSRMVRCISAGVSLLGLLLYVITSNFFGIFPLSIGASQDVAYKPLPDNPNNAAKEDTEQEVCIIKNVYWKELGLLVLVWCAFLGLQIAKNKTSTCSTAYWVLNLLQIPVSVGVSLYEASSLHSGRRKIASNGSEAGEWKVPQLVLYCFLGILAGIVGGLLGLGGGFILGPLFLELGIPPQVSSATSTFAMTFSSSMSVVEYYLLDRFPVPYAFYFICLSTVAAFIGQHVVRRLIIVLGRASLIIFILAFTIFVSAISLGGVGISNMIGKLARHEYMGFENLCNYSG